MSKAGFRVLDSDLHVIEPSDLYDRYLDPAYRDRTPRPTHTRGAYTVFSTDYPHSDSHFPEATNLFLKLPLSEQSKRKILWDNCARLYNVTGAA